jgi:hypothetical protein
MSNVDTTCAEEFRLIAGFPGYRIGSRGTVQSQYIRGQSKRREAWRTLKPITENKCGYQSVSFSRDGEKFRFQIHRLVLTAFVGPCPEGMECRHLDGHPSNNVLENLCWGNRVEQAADRRLHGTVNRGARNGHAKLTESDVTEIRRLAASGLTGREIGPMFGVRQQSISRIVNGQRWAHLSAA